MNIKIKKNTDSSMMSIEKGDENIFYGNHWDFDKSPEGLKEFLTRLGFKVEVVDVEFNESDPEQYFSRMDGN